MKEQMPGLLGKIDDPWGISWRIINLVKRFSLRKISRFVLGSIKKIDYDRPIFVIGVSRSGTTMLFRLLSASSELGALPYEGHNVWRMFHHPRSSGWDSDVVKGGEIRFGERNFVNSYFYSHFDSRRFVEKTPENSLRVPYLLDLFPDAHFVAIKRNPCDVINSLINGWRHPEGRFRSYYVPQELKIPDYPHRRLWCFALIEGWRNYISSPIHDIAFAQWEQMTQGIIEARNTVPNSNWTEIFFEHLLEEPDKTAALICKRIDINYEPRMKTKLAELVDKPTYALSPHEKNKWRRENSEEITALLPQIAETASEIGYKIDEKTGGFVIRNHDTTNK